MKNTLIMHIEDCKCNLSSPFNNLSFLKFPASMTFLLLDNELIHISSGTVLHNNIKFLTLLDTFLIGDDIDMFEFLQEFNLMIDVLNLLFIFSVKLDLLNNIFLISFDMFGKIRIPECSV